MKISGSQGLSALAWQSRHVHERYSYDPFYANLGTFTMVGRADFNAKLDKGYKLMARKETKSGRFTYNLASPKGDTGGAVNEAVIKENAALKAQLAELAALVAALTPAKA